MKFFLNGKSVTLDDDQKDHRLLWVLRDEFGILGPKYGCGIGVCGACSIHLDGEAERACTLTAADVEERNIITLEGLSAGHSEFHPVQKAWIDIKVPQCGYCQNGQIMTAAAMLERNPDISDDEITDVMDQVRCRCGTQSRIRAAIQQVRDDMKGA